MATSNLIGFVYNPQAPETAELVDTLVGSLDLRDHCWVSSTTDVAEERDKLEATSLVVIAGGDGTILRTVGVIAPFAVPMVAINMGRVGFMTELEVDEAMEKLPMYLDGGMRVEERMMLQASITSDACEAPMLSVHALNDVVLGRVAMSRLMEVHATVDGVPLTSYHADAVIVSTPTGSTGYALSAGGPVVHAEARVMLVQPVAAHPGLRSGLVLPEESVVELRSLKGRQALFSSDGFHETILEGDQKVTIVKSPHVARFLRARPPGGFYTVLERRLGLAYTSVAPDSL